MPTKRVSLKGRGADLFFGDFPASIDTHTEDVRHIDDANPEPPPIQSAPTINGETSPNSALPATNRRPRRSTDQPPARSTDQPTTRPTNTRPDRTPRSVAPKPGSRIVDRPKAFYITERLDARIDEAVRYYQQVHGLRKVDRSIVITAILDQEDQWSDDTLDTLLDRLINQLTSRLTGR